jgi:Carbamoyl-phosphate synthase small chain, CPSase domain
MTDQTRPPSGATAALMLADGNVFWGRGLGATGVAVAEVCFNTSMTGYQEILTDPSYAGQIICFTFPHIGIVGANGEDVETSTVAARGLVLRMDITEASNFRASVSTAGCSARAWPGSRASTPASSPGVSARGVRPMAPSSMPLTGASTWPCSATAPSPGPGSRAWTSPAR